MKNYKKTLLGSIVVFIIGTSCCWISSLAIWLGGAVIFGTISTFIGDWQLVLIIIGVVLLLISIALYFRKRKRAK